LKTALVITSFVQRAFKQLPVSPQLHRVADGEEAVAYLEGTGRFNDRAEFPFPHVVLLDLKMSVMDGFEVLAWMRNDGDEVKVLPVVVMTSSTEPQDKVKALSLGAKSFLTKDVLFDTPAELCKTVLSFLTV